MNPGSALLLAAGVLMLVACAPKAQEQGPGALARPKAVAVDARDRTFHSGVPKSDLLAATQARLGDSVDPVAFAAAAEKVNAYAYAPTSEPEPSSNPGAPVGTSFAADARSAAARVALLQGGEVEIACAFRPCMVRGDFDGDGVSDVAIQVARKTDAAGGIGLLLSGTPSQVLAAGNPGPLGKTTIWADGWTVEPVAAPQTTALKAAGARPAGAVIRLTGPAASGVAYLERAAAGGSVQLKAAVTSGVVR